MTQLLRIMTTAVIAVGTAGSVQAKTYSGSELEALRCSAVLSMTSQIAYEEGWISANDRSDMIGYTLQIESRYVSGTQEEKDAAVAVIWGRRTLIGTVEEFGQIADYCSQLFPIY